MPCLGLIKKDKMSVNIDNIGQEYHARRRIHLCVFTWPKLASRHSSVCICVLRCFQRLYSEEE